MKDYFEAKARLFESLRQSGNKDRKAVINVDDPYGQQLVGRFGRDLSIITYGMGARADFRASDFKVEMNGTSYRLDAKDKSYLVRLPLIGGPFTLLGPWRRRAGGPVRLQRRAGAGQGAPDSRRPGGAGQAEFRRLPTTRTPRCVVKCRQNLPQSESKPADPGLRVWRKQGSDEAPADGGDRRPIR